METIEIEEQEYEELSDIEEYSIIVTDYNSLEDKPSINGVELIGNKTSEELGILPYDDSEIKQELSNIDIEVDELTNNINLMAKDIDEKADETEIPTKVSQLENDRAYLTSIPNTYKTKSENDLLYQSKGDYALKSDLPDVSTYVTKSVNNLVNYYTKSQTYTKSEVNQLIGTTTGISMQIVTEKPSVGQSNVIYLIPNSKQASENIYDEYVYISNKWEIIGSTQVDLTNYYTIDDINTLLFDYITANDLEETLKDYVTVSQLSDLATKQYVEDYINSLNGDEVSY